MTTTTNQVSTVAAATPATTVTTGTAAAENPGRVAQQDLAAVDTASRLNELAVDTNAFFEARCKFTRCGKASIVALYTAAAELREFRQTLGDEFYDFARTRLGLTSADADFLLRVAEMGIDPAQFSPAVEMRMPRLMEALGAVVAAYNNINVAPPDSIDNVAPATNVTPTLTTTESTPADAMTTMPVAGSVVMPAVPESPVDATMTTPPPENTPVQPQVAADVVGNTFLAETEAAEPRHEGVGAQTE